MKKLSLKGINSMTKEQMKNIVGGNFRDCYCTFNNGTSMILLMNQISIEQCYNSIENYCTTEASPSCSVAISNCHYENY
jgi:natural product precursor